MNQDKSLRREKLRKRRKYGMRGGKLDSGIMTAQHKHNAVILYCPNCDDFRKIHKGKCKVCRTRLAK